MKNKVISTATTVTFGAALVILVLVALLVAFGVGGDAGVVAASDIGEVLVVGLSAAVLLGTSFKLGVRTSLGRPWFLMGLGASSFFVGDVIWTIIEVGMRAEVPYPGWPDLFYLAEYPLVAAGIVSAGMAFRGLVPMRRPALVAAVVGSALSAAVYLGLLAPHVFSEDLPMAEKALSSLYPLADILLMVVPAVFVIGVVSSLGGGRLAWQWWAVALGALVIAISDTGYSWLATYDLYSSGSIIDYGWSLGHAFMMLGGLIARDLAAPSQS